MTSEAILLTRVRVLCTETEGARGIWKRIDENREMLGFLQRNAPDLLERFPFLEIWLGNNDIFFVNLQKLLALPDFPVGLAHFPRRWPGNPCINGAYLDFAPAVAEKMALQGRRRKPCK